MAKKRSKTSAAKNAVAPPAPATTAGTPLVGRSNFMLLAVLVVAAAIAVALWRPWERVATPQLAVAVPTAAPASFLGSSACAGCHANATKAWSGSQHARAMQEATEQTVVGDFGDRRFEHRGSTATFSRRDGKFFVRTEGPDGKLSDFEVKYTFGVAPLQQYLIELPGGRLQALTIAWDTGAKRWFSLYPNEKIPAHDELHWTGRQQNWNFMCADCHSTNLRKNYDASTDTFATKWSEIHVGCESCHGPGSNHVAWAAHRDGDPKMGLTVALDERTGVRWAMDPKSGNSTRSRTRDADREIEVCAQCHARRAQIAEGYHAGKPFLDHYVPALLTPPLYYADGQQRDEVYNWGSFLQSRMYRQGVTCSDCHDPHTQKLKAPGNALCAQCHAAEKYDAPAHHFHVAGSGGAQCVNCHMPAANFMVIDARRDHSMRVPRPDQTVALGVPNACNNCHANKDAPWSAAAVRKWYGRDAQGLQTFAPTFRNAELGKPGAGASLAAVAADTSQPPIARASALDRMTNTSATAAATAARTGARNASPLLRIAAARLSATLPPPERIATAGPLLSDPLRAVRIEAANTLVDIPIAQLSAEQQAAWRRAADEYVDAQKYNADRPESRTNLGSFHARLGHFDEAQAEFVAARKLDPRYVPAYVNSADAYRQQGREADAMRTLKEGVAQLPSNATLHHVLGLAYARAQQRDTALVEFGRAVQLAPDNPRYTYVYAVALNSLGRSAEATRTLQRATARWPADRNILFALAAMERDAGHKEEARKAAQALVTADPEDREARALLEQLK
jgi:predicted CXXCH cytochrome family protein